MGFVPQVFRPWFGRALTVLIVGICAVSLTVVVARSGGRALWEVGPALTLTALGGAQSPLSELKLDLDERRFIYLTSETDGHGASVRRAGLDGLSREELVQAIEAKIRSGLMFHLRFVHGTRDGEPAPENDALMFTVPVEFPDGAGTVRRYQVWVKYSPASHSGEVVTFH